MPNLRAVRGVTAQLRMQKPLNERTGRELKQLLSSGAVSNREIVQSVLQRIEEIEPTVNAFLTVRNASDLLAEADAVDKRRLRKEPIGPLAGLPVAVKDNICTKGLQTSCGSRILGGYKAHYDATAVKRLNDAGACSPYPTRRS